MKDFSGKLAVVTGAGSGMGRELALQLASEGCHLAVCDIMADTAAETRCECMKIAPAGTRVTSHACDVSQEYQVVAFRDAVKAAKFAVNGFSEGLIIDLRHNAPHVKVSVVMPGHIGTNVGYNSQKILGKPSIEDMPASEIAKIRETMERRGLSTTGITDPEIKAMVKMQLESFRDNAPLTPKQAAAIILDGVRNEQWRILVGEDARELDRMVRETPEEAYELSFMNRLLEAGVYQTLLPPAASPEES
jgi:NAD(P)-dependent dehydrogenase (short-subunit alcohol dehydrogenase family)